MPYNNVGLASSVLQYENAWKEYFEKDWKKNQTYLKLTSIDFDQKKAYHTDLTNNYANNTKIGIPGNKQFTEILAYWNFYITDEKI